MGANLKVRTVGFNRKQVHPLAKTLKALTAESQDAVDILVKIMNDPEGDPKLKLAAASKLLDLQRQVAADINQDELQRIIGGIKYGGATQLEIDDDTPDVDFTQVLPAN